MSHSEKYDTVRFGGQWKTQVDVQGQTKLIVVLESIPRNKLCVDLVGPYTRRWDMPKFKIILKAVFTKPTSLEGLYNAPQSDDNCELSRNLCTTEYDNS